ncbi:MAG: CvpA family protein [Clostridiaceae bacterium]|nr:CvpA family protein [Clostridiaceae bacterium]
MSRERSSTDKIPLIMLLLFLAAIIALDYFLKWGLNWVDYTIIGVVFFSAFVGYVRGLIKAVFSLVGYIVAVICSVLFSEPVALFIMEKTQIRETIAKALENAYSNFTVPAFNQTVDFSVIESSNQLFEKFPSLKEFLNNNMMFGQLFNMANPLEAGAEVLSGAITSITDLLVFSVLKVISIIIVFFAVKLIISVIGGIINSLISQSNILSTTNKTIGLALGAVIGCLVVFVAASYVVPFLGSLNILNIPKEYGESIILGYFFATPQTV